MSSRDARYTFELARPEDSAEILDVLEEIDFKGNIGLTFTRRPDPYASFKTEGRRVDILVSRDSESGRLTSVAAAASIVKKPPTGKSNMSTLPISLNVTASRVCPRSPK